MLPGSPREILLKQITTLLLEYGARDIAPTEEAVINRRGSLIDEDLGDFFQALQTRYGTRWDGLDYGTYFIDGYNETVWNYVRRLCGIYPTKPLTLGHLADVVQRGTWFDPVIQ